MCFLKRTSDFLHLHIDLAQLVFEKLAAGSHHHFVHIDVMILERKLSSHEEQISDRDGKSSRREQNLPLYLIL